jgi:cobalt-zinc-cadmium efflux system outer membrane protein
MAAGPPYTFGNSPDLRVRFSDLQLLFELARAMLQTRAMLKEIFGLSGYKSSPRQYQGSAGVIIAILLLAILRAPAIAAAGETPSPGPLTLGYLLRAARANNSEIRAADEKYLAMRERPSQEGTLPDPSVGARYHNEQLGRITFGASDFSYLEFSAEQEIPFPGKLGLKESIASREAARELAMRDSTILSVLARVVLAYTDLSVADRSIAILDESSDVLDTVIKQTAQAYSVGTAVQQDILRATLERDALRERIAMLALQRTTAEAEINALLNRPANEVLAKTVWTDKVSILEPLDSLTRRLEAQAPELRAAEEDVLKTSDALLLAKRGYFPDLTAMGAYADKNGLHAEWELGLRFTVPLYFWRKQRPAVAEAEYNKRAAGHARQNSRVTLESRLREAHAMVETAMRLINLYSESLIPEASLTLKSARASYSVGKVDFLTTLNAFNALFEYRMRYTEQIGQYRRAVAEIGPLVGEPPSELDQGAPP